MVVFKFNNFYSIFNVVFNIYNSKEILKEVGETLNFSGVLWQKVHSDKKSNHKFRKTFSNYHKIYLKI